MREQGAEVRRKPKQEPYREWVREPVQVRVWVREPVQVWVWVREPVQVQERMRPVLLLAAVVDLFTAIGTKHKFYLLFKSGNAVTRLRHRPCCGVLTDFRMSDDAEIHTIIIIKREGKVKKMLKQNKNSDIAANKCTK